MKIPRNAIKVFDGIQFDVYQWNQEMYDGSEKIFEMLKRKWTVDICAITTEGKILVLRQEQPLREPFYCFPGGTQEGNEEPLELAKKELLEETGYTSDDWSLYKAIDGSSKIDYIKHIFIARNCKETEKQHLDGGEKIEVMELPLEEFMEMMADPEFRMKEVALDVLSAYYRGGIDEVRLLLGLQ